MLAKRFEEELLQVILLAINPSGVVIQEAISLKASVDASHSVTQTQDEPSAL